MAKPSKAQEEVIDALKAGCTIELHHYVRQPSIWKLHPKDNRNVWDAKTISSATIQALFNKGIVKHRRDLSKYPYRSYVELVETGEA